MSFNSKITFKEIKKIDNPHSFADTIYRNFEYLSGIEQLSHNRNEIVKLLTNDNFIGFLLYDEKDMIIAYLVGEIKHLFDGRIVYYISYIFVSEKDRNKRLGSKLLQILINKCKEELGIKFIVLTCDIYNKIAYDFYRRRGFKIDTLLSTNGRHEVLSLIL